jgi:uncharacterized UPF0160 family protein
MTSNTLSTIKPVEQVTSGVESGLLVATHSGAFHADDLFAIAFLRVVHGDCVVVRTRDAEILATPGIRLVDVGGEYNPSKGRFDHHFKGSPIRENGVPYASFGMVHHWESQAIAHITEEAEEVLGKLVEGIDAADNGIKQDGWTLSETVHKCNPLETKNFDERFCALVSTAVGVLQGILYEGWSLEFAVARFESQSLVVDWVEEYQEAIEESTRRVEAAFGQAGPIIELAQYEPALFDKASDAPAEKLFSVYPSPSGEWMVQQIPREKGSFAGRKKLPESWAGKRGADLDSITGIAGCVFTHPGRFIGGHKTLEGALQMAQIAAATEA